MRVWTEITRSLPGVTTTESFDQFHRAISKSFREHSSPECVCTSVHTVYPENKLIVFAFTVKADSTEAAQKLAEKNVEEALSSILVAGTR